MNQPRAPERLSLCVWTASSRNYSVHANPETLRRLAAEAWIGFKRVPRRGLEIGGLLLGRIERQNQLTTFRIEGFEPLESEHRLGPSYVLSEADLDRLDAIFSKLGPDCIGMFRSHTRSERPELQPADADLLQRYFRDVDALFLIAVPAQGSASLFAQCEGNLSCVHEFALPSSVAQKIQDAAAVAAQPAPALPEPAPAEAPRMPSPIEALYSLPPPPDLAFLDAPPSGTNASGTKKVFGYELKSVLWLLAGMLIPLGLVLATSMLSPSVSRSAARTDPLPQFLRLSVDQSGRSVTLRWDRNAAALQNAVRAVLHIEDGEYQADRHLAASQLREGSFIYQPRSPDVIFQLEIYANEPSAIGFAQVQAPLVARALENPQPAIVHRRTEETAPEPTRGKGVTPGEIADTTVRTAEIEPVAKTPAKNPAPPAPQSPDLSRESSGRTTHAEIPNPPQVAATPPLPPTTTAAKSPERPLAVEVLAEPVSTSFLGRVAEKIPLLRRTRKQVTAAPVPLYQPPPSLTPAATAAIDDPVSIGVKVSIAETGAVRNAEVVDYGEPPNWSAADAALAAARHWTFEPARSEDTAVPSEMILHFRFSP